MLSEWLFKLTKCIDSAKKKCQINAEIIQSPQILIFFFLSWHRCCFKVFCFLFSHYCSFEAGKKKKSQNFFSSEREVTGSPFIAGYVKWKIGCCFPFSQSEHNYIYPGI